MKNLILIGAAAALAACVMPEGGMTNLRGGFMMKKTAQETQPYVDETVEVVTVPAGAATFLAAATCLRCPELKELLGRGSRQEQEQQ